MKEAELLACVLELAALRKWRCYHTHDSRRSQAGFPDLVMVRWDRLIFAELKSEKGKMRPEQQEWADDLEPIAEHYIWRPLHWTNGTIEEVLA